jgi:dihydrofolate reductase
MKISLIVATDQNGVIGAEGELPWRLPADMKYFRSRTMGKPVIMGRKTYETIGAAPLSGRHNIVMTRAKDYDAPGCTVAHSVQDALLAAGEVPEVMIIGGAEIYRRFLPKAARIYLTLIEESFEGNATFPALPAEEWQTIWEERHTTDEGYPYSFRFMILDRALTRQIFRCARRRRRR